MPNYELIILEQAVSDIVESCNYYNEKIAGLGSEFEEEVFNLLDIISKNPLIFPIKFSVIHEAALLSFPFVVNYEVIDKQVIVYAIFHTKRNPDNKSKRKRSK